MPERIQLQRTKGWRMPPNTVKVDRSTRWGNPFKAAEDAPDGCGSARLAIGFWQIFDDWWTTEETVKMFEAWITGRPVLDPSYLDHTPLRTSGPLPTPPDLAPLRGKNLACWCKPGWPCHADVLLELANQ